jgi:predicted type IV restriction endonuclease
MMVVVNTTTEVGGCHDYIVHQGSRVFVVVERGFLGECMTSTATVVKTTIEV